MFNFSEIKDKEKLNILAGNYKLKIKSNLIFDKLSKEFLSDLFKELNSFIRTADIIIANRVTDELSEVKHKTFTRDIFNSDL